jgi:hypothetical protein
MQSALLHSPVEITDQFDESKQHDPDASALEKSN